MCCLLCSSQPCFIIMFSVCYVSVDSSQCNTTIFTLSLTVNLHVPYVSLINWLLQTNQLCVRDNLHNQTKIINRLIQLSFDGLHKQWDKRRSLHLSFNFTLDLQSNSWGKSKDNRLANKTYMHFPHFPGVSFFRYTFNITICSIHSLLISLNSCTGGSRRPHDVRCVVMICCRQLFKIEEREREVCLCVSSHASYILLIIMS